LSSIWGLSQRGRSSSIIAHGQRADRVSGSSEPTEEAQGRVT
jgi:hypothetical protein